MKINPSLLAWSIPALGLATAVTLLAWKEGPRGAGMPPSVRRDTLPAGPKKAAEPRDFDKELRQLEEASQHLKTVDWDKITKEVEEARMKFDDQAVRREVETALKQIDGDKIRLEIDAALKQVDFDKIQSQLDQSLKQIDAEKIRKELSGSMDAASLKDLQAQIDQSVKEGLASVDKEALDQQLARIRPEIEKELKRDLQEDLKDLKQLNTQEIDRALAASRTALDDARQALDKEKIHFDGDMHNAWKGIDKAKEELKGYQEMVYNMEEAGLLSTQKDYTIQYNNGTLIINGKEQPRLVADRYSKYFSHDKTTIRKEKGKLNVDID